MTKMLGYMIMGSAATILMQYMYCHKSGCEGAMKKMKEENEKAMNWLKKITKA